MKYLLVVTVCVGVFVISQILPQSDDERFYLINSSWSLLVAFSVIYIVNINIIGDKSISHLRAKIAIVGIVAIESNMTVINLITCIDYLNGKGPPYAFYPAIINSLNAIEAIVLVIGAPWIGAYNRFTTAIGNIPFISKRYSLIVSGLQKIKAMAKKSKNPNKGIKK